MEQKTEKNTQKEIPQEPLTADTYVDEFIEIASQKMSKTTILDFLKSWRSPVQSKRPMFCHLKE